MSHFVRFFNASHLLDQNLIDSNGGGVKTTTTVHNPDGTTTIVAE
jgi:hypothetical protein